MFDSLRVHVFQEDPVQLERLFDQVSHVQTSLSSVSFRTWCRGLQWRFGIPIGGGDALTVGIHTFLHDHNNTAVNLLLIAVVVSHYAIKVFGEHLLLCWQCLYDRCLDRWEESCNQSQAL